MWLQDKDSLIEFSENGAIASLKYRGVELVRPDADLIRLGLRDRDNNLMVVKSSDCHCTAVSGPDRLSLTFTDHPEAAGMIIRMEVQLSDGAFRFRPAVDPVPRGFRLEWIDPVGLLLKDARGKLLLPRQEGWLLNNPLDTNYEKPDFHYYKHYPGFMQMQFMAYYYPDAGLYFAAHDYRHATKSLEAVPEQDTPRLSFQLFCGDSDAPANAYHADFDFVVRLFQGDWMDACTFYRDWVQHDPALPPKGVFPAWVDDSPVSVLYPVQGQGADHGRMTSNEYFPYLRALPTIRKYREAFGSRIMALLMHWEGTAPWAPPYMWPPLGGEDAFRAYVEALHAEGNLIGVYCSGTGWTQTSSINDYSCEEKCRREGLETHMIRGPHDEIAASICNGEQAQRLGYDMCISEEWTRKTLIAEARKLAQAGVDYAQFFDQNLGGASHMCWAPHHSHPDRPGVWQTEGMNRLMSDLTATLRADGSAMALGCESAAADAYIKYLPFSDLRFMCWTMDKGLSVPAYAFVFHEYLNNFMGNQGGILQQMSQVENPDNHLYRTAYAFAAGDLLSIVLSSQGRINWSWGGVTWDVEPPKQQPIITLTRNLNDFRKAHRPFLQFGRMLKPLAKLDGEKWTAKMNHGEYELDAFCHSSWQAPDGSVALIVANFLTHEQKISVTPVPPVALRQPDGQFSSQPFSITVPPLTAAIMEKK